MGFRFMMKYANEPENFTPRAPATTPRGSTTTPNTAHEQQQLLRYHTLAAGCELWGRKVERPASLPTSKKFGSRNQRPQTVAETVTRTEGRWGLKKKVPILGPTRQQTELYLKKKSRHNVVPVGGPEEKLAEKIQPVRLNVFDTKAANAVLIDAEMQIKSGYPTIAASSMVSRRRRSETHDETDSNPDVKFFSELVKPIQYRWKFQRDKNRIIMPSKHGYHPRSKSPTFQRLVEATEKLQVIIEHDSGMGSFERDDELETRSQFSPGEPVLSLGAIEREIKSEPPSVTHSVYSIPPVKSTEPQSHERPIPNYKLEPDSPPKEIPKEEFKDSENEVIDEISDDEDEVFIEPEPHVNSSMQQTEFKVDFKKMDTHSELHLFLPLINSGHDVNESRAKPKSKRRVNKVALPSIDDVSQSKSEEKVTKKDRKSGEHRRKKKRAIPRIKSGHEDIEVKDILNDVTTLISMKKEQMLDYHTASMCMFENCDYHPRHNKSTKIRQA